MHYHADAENTGFNVQVAMNIKKLRAERGWYQTELAAKSGIKHRTIVNAETGAYGHSAWVIHRLSQTFGVPADTLFEQEKT